jgi:hypothetical protein
MKGHWLSISDTPGGASHPGNPGFVLPFTGTKEPPMDRTEIILAGLAAGGQGANFPPAQVQKLFFLLDREVATYVDGPHFAFVPYDYGPFDSDVYSALSAPSAFGLVEINRTGRVRTYSLTPEGFSRGAAVLDTIPEPARTFITRSAKWVNSLPFAQLVSAIYRRYPDMQVNSVFRG